MHIDHVLFRSMGFVRLTYFFLDVTMVVGMKYSDGALSGSAEKHIHELSANSRRY